jgi:galactose mutarotase-like enzyme
MFTYQQSSDHFQLHTLQDNAGTLLEIVPERGGIVSRFDIAGRPVFFLDRDSLNDPSKNVRGGNPVLFPICGPLAGGNYQLDGQTYAMKQHGFARNLPWSVVDQSTSADQAVIKLRLASSNESRAQYPFEFRVDFSYQLTANSLRIDQHYENHSERAMPFYAGFHPYFDAPEKSQVEMKVAANELDDFLAGKYRPAESVINFDAAAETNGAYHNVGEPRVRFNNFGQGRGIEIEFGEPYCHVVIWALKDKPFICVEPWMGLNNSLNTGESVVHLAPGAHLDTHVSFNIY